MEEKDQEKYEAILALDQALDVEIIKYAQLFVDDPCVKKLKILSELVTVDMYCDKFLGM